MELPSLPLVLIGIDFVDYSIHYIVHCTLYKGLCPVPVPGSRGPGVRCPMSDETMRSQEGDFMVARK